MSRENKAKKQKQVINNIGQLNLEIDYGKLAKAIVEANQKAKQNERDEFNKKEKIDAKKFFSAVWKIIKNKKDTNGAMLHGTFSIILSWFFMWLALAFVVSAVLLCGAIIIAIIKIPWTTYDVPSFIGSIVAIFLMGVTVVVMLMSAILLKGSANDIEREQDKNYIVAVFSAVVSLVALIVAFVSLYMNLN